MIEHRSRGEGEAAASTPPPPLALPPSSSSSSSASPSYFLCDQQRGPYPRGLEHQRPAARKAAERVSEADCVRWRGGEGGRGKEDARSTTSTTRPSLSKNPDPFFFLSSKTTQNKKNRASTSSSSSTRSTSPLCARPVRKKKKEEKEKEKKKEEQGQRERERKARSKLTPLRPPSSPLSETDQTTTQKTTHSKKQTNIRDHRLLRPRLRVPRDRRRGRRRLGRLAVLPPRVDRDAARKGGFGRVLLPSGGGHHEVDLERLRGAHR